MNENRDDMQFLKAALDAELKELKLPEQVKRTLSQKMKKPYGQPRRVMNAVLVAIMLCALLIYGLGGLNRQDLTDALMPASQSEEPSALTDVPVQKLDAMLLSAKTDDRGTIWLQYTVNTVSDEKVISGKNGDALMAYGTNETGYAEEAGEANIVWKSFNDYRESGPVLPMDYKGRRDAREVFCITGFDVRDLDGHELGSWRHDSHSLMQSGVIVSAFVPAEGETAPEIPDGDEVQLILEGVPMGSRLYTPLSGSTEAKDGRIQVSVELEK